MKLLVGLYEPQKGAILINSLPQKEVNLDSFRLRIGYVSQETELFAGTIRENLLFVKPDATDREMLTVLKHARIDHVLARGKGETGTGLDTKIGEAGIKLSGGERQRLAIARALLRSPNLIIFDEATSALDTITESGIIETIKEIRDEHPELMMVMVAHRLSTIQHADEIYLLRSGEVVEQGTHDELLDKGGLYESLWHGQTYSEEVTP
jgi:ATP-binding cassette subfamily B protein